MNEALVAEEIRSSPEQLNTRASLCIFKLSYHSIKVLMGLTKILAFRGDISIMETVIRNTELLHELKRYIDLLQRHLKRVRPVIPWTNGASWTERITTSTAEGVPPRHSETQVLLHRLPLNNLIRVVVAEREWILGVWSLVLNLWHVEILSHDLSCLLESLYGLARAHSICE